MSTIQEMVPVQDLVAFVEGRGYRIERVFNTTEMEMDKAPLRVVGLTLLGPRGSKGFCTVEDGMTDLSAARLWCDGIDYSTASLLQARERRRKAAVRLAGG